VKNGLIVVGMPLARPCAWLAFATMCATIAAAQIAARAAAARGGELAPPPRARAGYQREPRPGRELS
jgi:hypothetical protein